jgi:hypothetical protein
MFKKSKLALIIIVLSLMSAIVVNAQSGSTSIYLDFNSLPTGSSVEGWGAIHPYLNISTTTGGAVVIGEVETPTSYGAPSPENFSNGCIGAPGSVTPVLGRGKGFGDLGKVHSYTFSFSNEVKITRFAVRVLDFGDYNPSRATYHEIRLTALDVNGNVLNSDILSYESDGNKNPDWSTLSNTMGEAADACMGADGQPGNRRFVVTGGDIAYVTLNFAGLDPNIGMDNIEFDYSSRDIVVDIDIKPGSYPSCFNNDGHGTIPVAIFGSANFDATQIDPSTLRLETLPVEMRHGSYQFSFQDWNADGYTDMVAHFTDIEGVFEPDDAWATLTGQLYDGTHFSATGDICITQ